MNQELVLCVNYEGFLPEKTVFTISQKNRTQYFDNTSRLYCCHVDSSATKFSLVLNPVQASCFKSELQRSERYAKHVFSYFCKMCKSKPNVIAIDILLTPVAAYPIDHKL